MQLELKHQLRHPHPLSEVDIHNGRYQQESRVLCVGATLHVMYHQLLKIAPRTKNNAFIMRLRLEKLAVGARLEPRNKCHWSGPWSNG